MSIIAGILTAIYPYYISRREDGQGPMTLAPNGHGFMSLSAAEGSGHHFTVGEK